MKPSAAIIAPERIFFIREINSAHFSSEFHFHEECQLAYIIKGSGKRVVGDAVAHFDENELVFIGSNVPHVWYNTGKKQSAKRSMRSISLSLFISPQKFLAYSAEFGDTKKLEQLFKKAQRGMFIFGKSKLNLISLLMEAQKETGIQHIITLLKIIQALTVTKEYDLLASSGYTNNFQNSENSRMNDVYGFLMKNFTKNISLAEVAGIAAMNPHSFCRFFKSRTQKSLIAFVNEIRIGHACKLLNNPDLSITQIAYDSGFNNVSNFNRFFKIIKKTSPRQYRKELELD
jgi:AraC-like DNA-binding protein